MIKSQHNQRSFLFHTHPHHKWYHIWSFFSLHSIIISLFTCIFSYCCSACISRTKLLSEVMTVIFWQKVIWLLASIMDCERYRSHASIIDSGRYRSRTTLWTCSKKEKSMCIEARRQAIKIHLSWESPPSSLCEKHKGRVAVFLTAEGRVWPSGTQFDWSDWNGIDPCQRAFSSSFSPIHMSDANVIN